MQQLYPCCSGLEFVGIAYDYAERIKEESIGDASKVATEAYLTLGYRKTATPAKSSAAAMGNASSGHSGVTSQRWTAAVACALASGRGDRPATSGDGRALPRTWDSIGVDP